MSYLACSRCAPVGKRSYFPGHKCDMCGALRNTTVIDKPMPQPKAQRVAPAELWGCCSGADDPRSLDRAALAAVL